MQARIPSRLVLLAAAALAAIPPALAADPPPALPARVIAWNDLGMHCMDPGYSVFALLPPFNDFTAQLIVNGKLVTASTGYTLTYAGVADPTGSLNTTSVGKTDFWSHVPALFGVALPPDVGLAGHAMPGLANVPQPLPFDALWRWWKADGIPITPYDDGLANNTYPMLRVTAKDSVGATLASTVNVAPVSDEMDCSRCHASNSSPFAKPHAGWVFAANEVEDYRLNILRRHDEKEASNPAYAPALVAAGYDAAGLEATVVQQGTSILCARCHLSNALPGSGIAGVKPLTQALHDFHAGVTDIDGLPLDSVANRSACYTCHPGSATRCLRGAMGKAVAADGSLAMQCQSCHGTMTDVADPARTGWLDQPSCQQCHTGTALQNSGQIRFTSVFDANGNPHVPANLTFATDPNVPAPGFDLYRFSDGHGGLQCEACHGATHAEYPALHPNDNVQSIQLQGHVGVLVECASCHVTVPATVNGGPHGMHPLGQQWVHDHGDAAEDGGAAQCRACHGTDYRGTVLSYSQANRTLTSDYGTKSFWRGFQVGCYNCHNGPNSENPAPNQAPVVTNKNLATPADQNLVVSIAGTDINGNPLTYRIVDQPEHGTVALAGSSATYYPEAGYVGPAAFTFAAFDGFTNSNLGTASIAVGAPACHGSAEAYGFGCPGSAGHLPQLELSGCPTSGGAIVLELHHALGGAPATIFLGAGQGEVALAAGCVLRVLPLLPVAVSVSLTGAGPGQGGFSIPAVLPAGLPPATLGVQVFVGDPGVPNGYSASNALSLHVE